MFTRQNIFIGKRRYLSALILLAIIPVLCAAFGMAGDDDFDIATREILLRRIGHELLLQSGDSTSRVLPVKKVAENEYRITFEHEFAFEPANLVSTTKNLLAKDPMAGNYIVNVLNCDDSAVAYGFAVSENKKDNIVACIGRKQPKACYIIDIKFEQAGMSKAQKGYLLGGLPLLAFAGFFFFISVKKPRKITPDIKDAKTFALGTAVFDTQARQLVVNGETTDLTGTETRLLLIFAMSPNEVIERSRLQKEIWEDEGVVVGRSLDMFISKLRKKLEPDPDINIVVVRGKGYKLEIAS